MANEDAVAGRSLMTELFATEVYKRSQGRMVRQVTFIVIATVSALGAWRLFESVMKEMALSSMGALGELIRYGVPVFLLVLGAWVGYRLVNWPKFADFLISVEAEMNKVSWPGRSELVKASIVVIVLIALLAMLLFCYDLIWQLIFSTLRIS